ncbi:hypothetical protein [Anaeromyxobacter diazotrophicus]|uniref:STAS/SEC14 domain-containing protein n=1 Tax=Anaeromyxobacter diazotrophicus TaxID=2590199 RepID=A0A7I9VIT0_9BACT|nr:hypothetical protein [Anaeromyxobacter diazotrophicus]GEJ55937.1 hypothetical protein AMYX_06780 [Anaeromyxobacter diazotrophicus]
MFAPTFVQHRGARILRIDLSALEPRDLIVAADQVRRIVTAEPPRSVRALTLLYARLTGEAAAALKACAQANTPHIRASAMVGSSFWRVIAADVQARGREELALFDDEASALDWLAAQ